MNALTLPKVITDPQVVIEPKNSRSTSTDVFDFSRDKEEPYDSTKASDTIGMIDCVAFSSYQVRSSSGECMKLDDDNFDSRANSKSNTNTEEHHESNIQQQNPGEYNNLNVDEKSNFENSGNYYFKSNEGHHGTMVGSDTLFLTTPDSAIDSGLEQTSSTLPRKNSLPTGGELDATDLNDLKDQTDDNNETDFSYDDDPNSTYDPESDFESDFESDYSSYDDDADISSISDEQNLSPSDSRYFVLSSSSSSQNTPDEDISVPLNSPDENPSSDNTLIDNTGSHANLDQGHISGSNLEDKSPQSTSQNLPNTDAFEEPEYPDDIFGTTQPYYDPVLRNTLNSWPDEMRPSSMVTHQHKSDTTIDETQSSDNNSSAGSSQIQDTSSTDEENTSTMPDGQDESEIISEDLPVLMEEVEEEAQ